ncbi:TIGR02530 family flagellar biosynthesis protein [Bacillus sp. FJAT-50079]|uniref:TIGR02530 family flagellar biosynthesis protein n=1 Tax=Bacillus sp. FJAT-50079 TaxID=2833577 RepID=UPI001BC97C4F|nr:TIGR02530 family flagellar biosynthesis protein [Bacillus sp. FJAT-50079]MBS4207619.1 flagellar protein [Bacillus sp. FJAT-50079]
MGNSLIHQLQSQPMINHPITKKNVAKNSSTSEAFSTHLQRAETNLAISKHAEMRMEQRQINIQPHVWKEIGAKVDEAKQKGVKNSLVLLQNAALIVSAKNSTVVTVMDRQEAGSQIFTKIDGTIIIDE